MLEADTGCDQKDFLRAVRQGRLTGVPPEPTAAELSENPFDEATLKTMKLVVEGDKYTVTVGKSIDKGATKIDPAAKPKTMDILGADGPNKGKTFLAIYELNGDTLRVCYDLTGKVRSTEFKTKKGELLFLATNKRAKS